MRGNSAARACNSATQTDTESMVLRKYYEDHDYLLSPEGILRVLSVILCIVSSVLLFSGGSCGGAPLLVTGGATVALVCAAALACLYAAAALSLPALAPMGWLFTDLILSTVIGLLLLLMAIFSMTFCDMQDVIDYVHGPLAILNAVTVMASAVITYVAVTRCWDEARGPALEPRPPPPNEQDA